MGGVRLGAGRGWRGYRRLLDWRGFDLAGAGVFGKRRWTKQSKIAVPSPPHPAKENWPDATLLLAARWLASVDEFCSVELGCLAGRV